MLEVKSIKNYECKEWLLNKHYAKRMCSISYAFGLYIDNILNGVCTFGKPASNSLCVGVCGKNNSRNVYELNRLITNDNLIKNSLSFFVSQCLKTLPSLNCIINIIIDKFYLEVFEEDCKCFSNFHHYCFHDHHLF